MLWQGRMPGAPFMAATLAEGGESGKAGGGAGDACVHGFAWEAELAPSTTSTSRGPAVAYAPAFVAAIDKSLSIARPAADRPSPPRPTLGQGLSLGED